MGLADQLKEGTVVTADHVAALKAIADLVHRLNDNREQQVQKLSKLLKWYGRHHEQCQIKTGEAPEGHRLYRRPGLRLPTAERICTCHWNECVAMIAARCAEPAQVNATKP